IHAIPPPDFLKPSHSSEPPTPHYNSTVLGDHLPLSHLQFLSAISAQCPAFGEGVALLKVWLRQRELDQVRPQYFQDRAMTEAVLWSGNSISHRRFVLLKIIAHLLELHADIPKSCIRFVGGPLDIVIKVGKEIHTTGEEESLKVVQSYNDLSKKLWQLKGLPLSITSVQGAHQALRYTQFLVFFDRKKNHLGLVPKENKPCPYYITPIKVIVHMKGSGKWPSEHMAIRHVKAAFHICLGELLCKQHKYKCHATPTYLDVWKVMCIHSCFCLTPHLFTALLRWGSFASFICFPLLTGKTIPIVNLNGKLSQVSFTLSISPLPFMACASNHFYYFQKSCQLVSGYFI
uniref:Nucleolar protein 6 n=1 Tax=Sinocyclocheilus grahami TaxID=75366 RepID=A0A672M885_SINGR